MGSEVKREENRIEYRGRMQIFVWVFYICTLHFAINSSKSTRF